MKPEAIVYSSNTGFSRRYAEMFGAKTGLSVCNLDEAKTNLRKETPIVYFSWLMAGTVKDYRTAAKLFDIKALCGVCLGTTGSQVETVRKSCRLSSGFPVFTLQGGMDHQKLDGVYKKMISVLTKFMQKKKNRSADEEAMLSLLISGGDFVSEENLEKVMEWYENA